MTRIFRRGPKWFCTQCAYMIRTRDQHPTCPKDGSPLLLAK